MKKGLLEKVSLYVKSLPKIYPILKKVRDENGKDKVCSPRDQLCIEGYPSSGNSFGYNFLKILFPNLNICHHSHSVANIKRALQFGVPTIVLIRRPDDCITSRCVRFGDGEPKETLRRAAREYVWFYRYVSRVQSSVRIVSFEVLIDRPRVLANYVTDTAYVKSPPRTDEEVAFASEYAQKIIQEWSQRHAGNAEARRKMSVPTEERSRLKERMNSYLDAVDEMPAARELYEDLVQ